MTSSPWRGTLIFTLIFLAWTSVASADLVISRRACNWLVEHHPSPDVEYQAGVDVHGRAVAPADLDGGANLVTPDFIVIPLEVLLEGKYGIAKNSVLWRPKAEVGTVVAVGDQIYYEGQRLGYSDQVALARACRERGLVR